MNLLKNIWNWIVGSVKSLLDTVLDAVLDRAKQIAADKDIAGLALNAVKAAAKQGLTGDAAWTDARDRFTAALRDAGRELSDVAIDTTLQSIYAAWKSLGKPEA